MGLLDVLSRCCGWRDEMASWMVTGFVASPVPDRKMEVWLMGPWRSDGSLERTVELEVDGDGMEVAKARMGNIVVGASALTVVGLAAPEGCLPTWKESEA